MNSFNILKKLEKLYSEIDDINSGYPATKEYLEKVEVRKVSELTEDQKLKLQIHLYDKLKRLTNI